MRIVIATGVPPVDAFLQALPADQTWTAARREDVAMHLSDHAPDEMPNVVIVGEPLPGDPQGHDFPLMIRRYFPSVRVLYLARDGFAKPEDFDTAGVEVLVGHVTGSRLAGLLGIPLPGIQLVASGSKTDASPAPAQTAARPVVPPGFAASEARVEATNAAPIPDVAEVEVVDPPAPEPDAPPPPPAGGVVAVWSPKSEGATVTALHLAHALAVNGPTLLLDLNLRRPAIATSLKDADLAEHNVDQLWSMLAVDSLTPEYLGSQAVLLAKAKGAPALLGGTMHAEYAGTYPLESVSRLLAVARSRFNNVVVDIPADLDNAATEAAQATADVVLVVLRANLLSLKTYERVRSYASELGVDSKKHRIVLTARRAEDPYGVDEIAKHLQVPVVATLPFAPMLDTAISKGELLTPGSKTANEYLKTLQGLTWEVLHRGI